MGVFYAIMLIQYAGSIGNGFLSVMIGHTGIPADLVHEQAVAFHTGNRLIRKTAGFICKTIIPRLTKIIKNIYYFFTYTNQYIESSTLCN